MTSVPIQGTPPSTAHQAGATTRQAGPVSFQRQARWPLIAMVSLALLTVLAVGFYRMTGMVSLRMPETPVAAYRDIRFVEQSGGVMSVVDAATGTSLTDLAPDSGGFIRGVVRALAHERKLNGVPMSEPVRLARRVDGQLVLIDAKVKRTISLEAFGRTNLEAFARFLPQPVGKKQ